MAYRTYRKTRKVGRKKTYKKKVRATSLTRRVKRVINTMAEHKYLYMTPLSLTFAVGGQVFPVRLWEIIQGNTSSTRIGNRIRVNKIEFRCMLGHVNATVDPLGDQIDCQYWLDTKPNGAAAAIGAIYDAIGAYSEFRNVELMGRFRLLAEHQHVISVQQQLATPVVTTATLAPRTYQFTIPFKSKELIFDLNGTTIADLQNWTVLVVTRIRGTSTGITASLYNRVHYTDA